MVSKIYFWFDWFIYMNMLLSQIDMILLESSVDVILSLYIMYYLWFKIGPIEDYYAKLLINFDNYNEKILLSTDGYEK